MTQPPQPPQPPQQPNEPQKGGFGAPQDPPPGGAFGPPQQPPAGGFGAPTPPPPDQPGGGFGGPPSADPASPPYGYPQAPPQQAPQQMPPQPPGAPGAAPGYGFPGQQAPQGPPQGPPGQGYGYPTTPVTYQQPPQSGGGKKLTTTELRIIVSAALAVVLILGGGIWYSNSGGGDGGNVAKGGDASSSTDSGKGAEGDQGGQSDTAGQGGAKEKVPADINSKVAFQAPMPKVTDLNNVAGSWATDTVYAKTGIDQIVGYDADKGNQLWSVPLPGQLCAASRHLSDDGKAAIAFEPAKRKSKDDIQPCTKIGVIDLASGRLLWSKSVVGSNAGDEDVQFSEVTQSGKTVAAGGFEGGAGFDLDTGAVRWKPQVSTDGCYDMGYGGGSALVAARKCGGLSGDEQVTVESINPATGATLSSYKMPAGVEYVGVISTKPLVVAADVGDTAKDGSGISDFFSIDERTGKLKAKIPADADTYAGDCGSTKVEQCSNVLVGNGKLYLPTEDHDADDNDALDETNEVVSFDLATGKTTSDRADAGNGWSTRLLAMDGPDLIAYKTGPYNKGGQIVSIDGKTFKQTTLMQNPSDESVMNAEDSFSSRGSEVIFRSGHLFLSQVFADKPLDAEDAKKPLVLAFTTH